MEYGDSEAAMKALRDFYPARAIEVMQVLVGENKKVKKIVDWREQQMVKFILSLTYSVDELMQGFIQKRIWKLAWAARNLLELSVWIAYCDLSIAKAKQFRDDSARDMLGVSKTIQEQMVANYGAPSEELEKVTKALIEMADRTFGVPGMKDDYTRVSNAAKELKIDRDFAHANKLMSKYAHPTAISLNSALPSSAVFDADIRNMFLSEGAEYAIKSLTILRNRVARYFPDVEKQQSAVK